MSYESAKGKGEFVDLEANHESLAAEGSEAVRTSFQQTPSIAISFDSPGLPNLLLLKNIDS